MKYFFLMMILFISACSRPFYDLSYMNDYDRIEKVENVSFFGEKRSDQPQNKSGNIQLLYKEGRLKYISYGNRKPEYYQVREIDRVNDSLTIITRTTKGHHKVIDTAFITSNAYYSKEILFCGITASVHYTTYRFTRKHFICYREYHNFFPDSDVPSMESYIASVSDNKRNPTTTIDTLYKYADVSDEKLKFLRRYFFHR